ncbi:uncharacterized protein LOC135384348 [Ornithodoros turicata]|uniref:uncharacterized protein LOC135384348 n=1 Tax=Ornithodoros turicata TaxID=34597 RepID=UPI00313A10FF
MSSSSEGMEDIERLKPRRTVQRGRNTKIINYSNKRLEKINEEIDPQIPSAEIEEEYSVIAEYEDQALSALARLKCAINKLNAGRIATAPQNVTEAGEESAATAMVTSNIRAALSTGTGGIKLQKLETGNLATVLGATFRAWAVTDTDCTYLRGVIDGGSQKTFVREDISGRLELPVLREIDLRLSTFAVNAPSPSQRRNVVRLKLKSQFDKTEVTLEAMEIPFLRERGMDIADRVLFPSVHRDTRISVLIGSEQLWKIVKGNVQHDQNNSAMVAIDTSLGWTFQGPMKTMSSVSEQNDTLICVLRTAVDTEDDTSLALRRFWNLEDLGINNNPTPDRDDQDLMQRFESSIEFQNGRYQVNLPFKQLSGVDLQNNRGVALERLSTRMARDSEMLARYDGAIRTYLEEGHAEMVKPASDEADTGQVYYMPHRPVIRESLATTKLRVVFDASSHVSGALSLNDCLEKGPKMVPDLVRLPLKFRLHRIAITADVRKAFLQIGIKEEDRDVIRFLWCSAPPTPGHEMPPAEESRMTAIAFGTAASPFLLAATLSHHLRLIREEFPETAAVLESSIAVDDMIIGAATLEEALRICSESIDIFKRAGMELGTYPKDVTRALGTTTETKVLGVVWKREDDVFKFDTSAIVEFLTTPKNTKRFLLQATARIFDPLGYLSPFVIRVKILFQQLWELGIDWDCELPDDLSSDPHAYEAAVYLRVRTETGQVHVNLMLAKARVPPVKRLTLPRLELMSTLIEARLLSYAADILHAPAAEYYTWTDSTTPLSWIRSSANRWKPFVSNRVTEIESITDPSRWRHCPGHCNPADLIARGFTAEICVSSSLWWRGPEWLQREEACWPELYAHVVTNDRAPDVVDEERAGASSPPPYLILGVADIEGPLLQLERFSKLSRVLRVTVWIMRFVAKCR